MTKFYHSNSTSYIPEHKSTIVLLYAKDCLGTPCHFGPFKPLALQLFHAKLLGLLTSFPESIAILLHVLWFVTSLTENHVLCSYVSAAVNRHLCQSEDVY